MMELYGYGPSRWVKCYWMLNELGQKFEEHLVKVYDGSNQKPEFLALNPFGKIPVFKDGDTVVFESMAILNYLGDKYPESKLVPKAGTAERAYYDQWNSVSLTELEQPLWRITKHTRILPADKKIDAEVEMAKQDFAKIMKVLDVQIGDKKFILGSGFSAADITLAYTFGWANRLGLISEYPNVVRYFTDLTSRPAFPRHLYES